MAVTVFSADAAISALWNKFQSELPKLGGELRPKKSADVFSFDDQDGQVHVTAKPICLSVRERGAVKSSQLFVTIEGILTFDQSSSKGDLRTYSAKTNVAYFREVAPTRLKHVYGVHYDHDPKPQPAHPVFHSQMGSMRDMARYVNDHYHRSFADVGDADDLVGGVLPNVRIPTAFMDVFSTLLQVAGDHLIHKDSDAARRGSFTSLRKATSGMRTAATAAPILEEAFDLRCSRAPRWYP